MPHTMELEVENASFMLDKLGADCEPLQFLRELTENAVQAVHAGPTSRGEVIWDLDWVSYDADGLVKLSCIDTGIGMSAEELKRYINHLSASRHEQRLDGNYGIGAKVAAATRNPHGMVYLSWKHGRGSMIQLWRDPATEKWGLKQFHLGDGVYDHCVPLDDAVKPEALRGLDHGTVVVLLGDRSKSNTMEPPAGIENRQKWVAKYLNQRYYRFPGGVDVKVREQWDVPRPDRERGYLRRIHGQHHYLERHSVASGTVPLGGAVAHWWILDEHHVQRAKEATWASTGHRAALYQNELYELISPSRGGYQRVQEFGVRFSYSRVVIYVEPQVAPARLSARIDRSDLRLDGRPLPWTAWADQFASRLPREIRELEEETAAGSVREDHRDSIRERLRSMRHLYRLSRYRPADSGREQLGPPDTGGRSTPQRRERKGQAEPGGEGGTGGNIYALFQTPGGPRGDLVEADPWPDIDWVSATHEPPTRMPPHLEDRAARYDVRTNRIEINEDFRVFQDAMSRWEQQFARVPGAGPVVRAAVREWYAQTLVETVLGGQALRGSRHWSDANIDALLSAEALTAAVQPRYLIEERLKRDLRSQLGARANSAA